jgi:metal-responsive CopG/Arc/MetJ family transcriptional regulator
VRLSDATFKALDQWAKSEKIKRSKRSEAFRRLVEHGLAAKRKEEPPS